MFLALIASLWLYLPAAVDRPQLSGNALRSLAAIVENSSRHLLFAYDLQPFGDAAERELLDKANADRARAGLPALKMDDGLVQAARAHAAEMAAQKHLSHQFSGEPSLVNRIAAVSDLHLEQAGENVAVATNVKDAHRALMSSPPHRENLLSPKFNRVGFAVVRQGHVLYVVEDFGMSIKTYSVQQAEEMVAASIEQLRLQANLSRLELVNGGVIESSACAMARADSLRVRTPDPAVYLLRYTTMAPETIPSAASEVIGRHAVRAFAVGTCYARSQNYPNGAYWVVVEFY
jgi:uncharacterized protein YkwD